MIDLEAFNSWSGIKVSRSIPVIRRIIEATYPNYKGRKIKLRSYTPHELHSYWDEGSRDTFALVNLNAGTVGHMESNHPFFEAQRSPIGNKFILPPMCILVMHSIFMGKDSGLTIYVNLSDINALDLTEERAQITG